MDKAEVQRISRAPERIWLQVGDDVTSAREMAEVDFSEASWEQTKHNLRVTHERLLEAIGTLNDSRLDQPIINHPEIKFSSVYVTLHGGVQHDLYHAGQIAILKKALGL